MTDYLRRDADYTNPAIATVFDEMSYWASCFARLIFDNLALQPGLRILDAGCGTGCPLFELAHMHGPTCQFVGVDVWRAGLQRAALKHRIYHLPNIALVEVEDGAFPLASASFDLIVANLVLNNLAHPEAVLRECARVARPGAQAVFTTNLVGHMREFYAVYRAVLADFGNPLYLERLAANEAHRGTRESHQRLLEGAGFTITRVLDDSFTMRYLDGSALLRHSLTVFGFLGGWRAVIDPADEVAVFEALEARLNTVAARQGGLAMTVPMLYLEATRQGTL